MVYDGACGGVKISRADVVAESLPRAEHVVFTSVSQRGKIREAAEPLVVIRNDSGDLSLLEHEFGNQDGVRIARLSPGEVAAVAAKPAEKVTSKRAKVLWRCHGSGANVQRPALNVQPSVQKMIEH